MTETRYTVMVDDNFHYMDAEHRLRHGEFASFEEAVAACKRIVDEELRDMQDQGVSLNDLSATWSMYGSDPFVVGGPGRFSARDYVAERVRELASRRWWRRPWKG